MCSLRMREEGSCSREGQQSDGKRWSIMFQDSGDHSESDRRRKEITSFQMLQMVVSLTQSLWFTTSGFMIEREMMRHPCQTRGTTGFFRPGSTRRIALSSSLCQSSRPRLRSKHLLPMAGKNVCMWCTRPGFRSFVLVVHVLEFWLDGVAACFSIWSVILWWVKL